MSDQHVVSVAPGNTNADEPYLGTDPVYQNHANDTEAPLVTELDSDADEAAVKAAYVEETAYENQEEAETVSAPGDSEPPKTVDEIKAYEKDKAKRAAAARVETK